MCLPPYCFETRFAFVTGFEEGQFRNFSKKSKKNDEVIEGAKFMHFGL